MVRWIVVLITCSGCGRIGFGATADDANGVDANDAMPIPVCGSFGPWSQGVQLTSLSSPTEDWSPALSPDGSLLVFESKRSGNNDLFVANRVGPSEFGTPVALDINSDSNDAEPSWSSDGEELYFTSSRSGTDEIWVSSFTGLFAPPTQIGLVGFGSDIAPSGLEIFYTVGSPLDLARATRSSVGAPWVPQTTGFENLNLPQSDEGFPSILGDGLTIYFEGKSSGEGLLYEASRVDATASFGTPSVVVTTAGAAVVALNFVDPDLSLDGTTLVFASDLTGDFELYIATRSCL